MPNSRSAASKATFKFLIGSSFTSLSYSITSGLKIKNGKEKVKNVTNILRSKKLAKKCIHQHNGLSLYLELSRAKNLFEIERISKKRKLIEICICPRD